MNYPEVRVIKLFRYLFKNDLFTTLFTDQRNFELLTLCVSLFYLLSGKDTKFTISLELTQSPGWLIHYQPGKLTGHMLAQLDMIPYVNHLRVNCCFTFQVCLFNLFDIFIIKHKQTSLAIPCCYYFHCVFIFYVYSNCHELS